MVRSVLLVVESACAARVIARASALSLATDATVRVISSARFATATLFEVMHDRAAELVIVDGYRRLGLWSLRLLGQIPTLVVRGPQPAPYERGLVALDTREDSAVVLAATRQLLARPELHLDLVQVRSQRAHSPEASRSLEVFTRSDLGRTHIRDDPDVRRAIATTARDLDADLLVLGSRPRSTLARLLIGSTSRAVIQRSSCDVLVLPLRDRRDHVNVPLLVPETR